MIRIIVPMERTGKRTRRDQGRPCVIVCRVPLNLLPFFITCVCVLTQRVSQRWNKETLHSSILRIRLRFSDRQDYIKVALSTNMTKKNQSIK